MKNKSLILTNFIFFLCVIINCGVLNNQNNTPSNLIIEQPQNFSKLGLGEQVTFNIKYSTNNVHYQWQTSLWFEDDFIDIPGAINTSYTTPKLKIEDHKRKYRCVIYLPSGQTVISNTVSTSFYSLRRIVKPNIINGLDGNGDFGGDGGLAINALLNRPRYIEVDKRGNIYIVDTENLRIRKIYVRTGIIHTFAGDGDFDDAILPNEMLAIYAKLASSSSNVVTDSIGNLYIIYRVSQPHIRKIDGRTGIISTIAGTGVVGFSGDGGLAMNANFHTLRSIAVDHADNIYIIDNDRLRKIDGRTGIITTIAGTDVEGFSGDGGLAINAQLNITEKIVIDSKNNIYLLSAGQPRLRKIDGLTGIISTIAGTGVAGFTEDGSLARNSRLNTPVSMAVDSVGNIFIAETERIRKINVSTGIISTLLGEALDIAIDKEDNLYLVRANDHSVSKLE